MNNNMNFYYYDKTTLLRKSKNGNFEPYGTENDIVDLSENIICIVPGLTFVFKWLSLGVWAAVITIDFYVKIIDS